MSNEKKTSTLTKFVIGGLSGMGATCVVQPMDVIKSSIQVSQGNNGISSIFLGIVKQDGLEGLYSGIGAGLLRQATYTFTRLGVFNTIYDYAKEKLQREPPFTYKLGIGLTAGALASIVGNPAEVALIRMSVDGLLPMKERRNYGNVAVALSRIIKEEGVLTLWRGVGPTIYRAMAMNSVQLGLYAESKERLLSLGLLKDGILLHFTASIISGFFATTVSLPFDMAKTRLQNMKNNEYKNILDVWKKIYKVKGITGVWSGFGAYLFRLGPHTTLTFVFMEQLQKLYKIYLL